MRKNKSDPEDVHTHTHTTCHPIKHSPPPMCFGFLARTLKVNIPNPPRSLVRQESKCADQKCRICGINMLFFLVRSAAGYHTYCTSIPHDGRFSACCLLLTRRVVGDVRKRNLDDQKSKLHISRTLDNTALSARRFSSVFANWFKIAAIFFPLLSRAGDAPVSEFPVLSVHVATYRSHRWRSFRAIS